jgi:hypothetical protein
MTHHGDHTSAYASPDTEVEGAEARPAELTDKTPPEHTGVEQRPLSTSPNNEAEAQEGAIAPQERQKEPGEAFGGGQSGG